MIDNVNETRSLNNFGSNLKRLLNEKNLSREEFADMIGLNSARVIYDYEDGLKFPKTERFLEICIVLGQNMDDMLR